MGKQPRKTYEILKLFVEVVVQDPAGKFAYDNARVIEWACGFLGDFARSLHEKQGESKVSSAPSMLLRNVLWSKKQIEQVFEIVLEVCTAQLQEENQAHATAATGVQPASASSDRG